ncbi:hypothetical protein DY000_02017191 [Brassica cretica]|uniref:Uncharacterized protein n=1 Tax=Brassica cretica TaxID=69181 RepID=A0ABQ7CSG1_BRACR|nr:hypothetical protein DY000_02017191 [Brassica cretica]
MFLLSVDVGVDGVFRCTWCCDVGANISCGGVVRCVEVTKLCIGVGILVGILDVR